MWRRSLPGAVLISAAAIATGCGSGADRRAAGSTSSPAAAPGQWVSIENCDAVEAILAAAETGRLPDARTTFAHLNLGRESKIRLTEDGMIAFVGGGPEGTATCNFDHAASSAKPTRMDRRFAGAGNLSAGFSSLTNPALPVAPDSIIADFRSMHPGSYADAKYLGRGMYLATNPAVNGICAWVLDGFGQCVEPDRIDGDVWLHGDMRRDSDAQTAPFEVNLYGFARDGVTQLRITTHTTTHAIPITNNAFRGTLASTMFGDISAIHAVYSSGRMASLNTASLFPARGIGLAVSAASSGR